MRVKKWNLCFMTEKRTNVKPIHCPLLRTKAQKTSYFCDTVPLILALISLKLNQNFCETFNKVFRQIIVVKKLCQYVWDSVLRLLVQTFYQQSFLKSFYQNRWPISPDIWKNRMNSTFFQIDRGKHLARQGIEQILPPPPNTRNDLCLVF